MVQASDTGATDTASRELKFVVTPEIAGEIRQWSRGALAADPHAGGEFGDVYATTSLYFDTPGLDVYHRRGSFKRSKYRIRRYGTEDVVFLERKLRTGARLSKRRTSVSLASLPMLGGAPDPTWPGFWFQQRIELRRLRPTCQVSYTRVARVGTNGGGAARLTLDLDIRVHASLAEAFATASDVEVLPAQGILELKFGRDVPEVFARLVETFALTPLIMSKYRLSVEALSRTSSGAHLPRLAAQERPRPAGQRCQRAIGHKEHP
jgi:hypothetical protein